jgi:hypothetical protein
MRRSFGLATTVAITISTLLAVLVPGVASASPSDPTIYPINCPSNLVDVYLAFGVSSITITNPNGCSGTDDLYLGFGTGSTWTYSKTISGTTSSGSWDPAGINLPIGTLGSADSFSLTLTSTTDVKVIVGNAQRQLDIYFNTQVNTLSPDPVGLGQQVTVTGNNLSSVTSLTFYGTNSFTATTANRTATQLTFTVPLTVTDSDSEVTSNITPGTYSLSTNSSKTIVLITAPIVVSVSAEELARREAQEASAQREAEKQSARSEISNKIKSSEKVTIEIFQQAQIAGITEGNIDAVKAELTALPEESRTDITQILKVARKYEVVGIVASERVKTIYSNSLIEIGLIPEESKYKATLTRVVKGLSQDERSSYAAIKVAIDAEMAEIQARKDQLTAVLTRIAARRAG